MADIRLSIVTVTYNCAEALGKTLRSVEKMIPAFYWKNIEYIVIDGKSTDATVEVAKRGLEVLHQGGACVTIQSENDSGIYNAMNKGLLRATGEWVYMLNAGDTLNDLFPFDKIYVILASTEADVVYGKTNRVHPDFSEIWEPAPLEQIRAGMIFCHQSVFIRRMLQEHHYSEKYQYCADYDMLLRMYLAGYKFHYIDYMICDYDLEGLTATKAIANAYREIYQIRKAQGVLTASNVEKARYWIGLAKRYMILYMPNKLRWGCTKFKRRLDGILSKKVA